MSNHVDDAGQRLKAEAFYLLQVAVVTCSRRLRPTVLTHANALAIRDYAFCPALRRGDLA